MCLSTGWQDHLTNVGASASRRSFQSGRCRRNPFLSISWYVVVFIDYLTKWVEAIPTKDQTALTIAKLLVEQVISRHGAPHELLCNRGAAFLLSLLKDVRMKTSENHCLSPTRGWFGGKIQPYPYRHAFQDGGEEQTILGRVPSLRFVCLQKQHAGIDTGIAISFTVRPRPISPVGTFSLWHSSA